MRVYTVSESFAGLGAEVVKFQAAGIVMPVIMVGEEGRGRCRGILPVRGLGPEAKRVECGRLASLPSGLPVLIAGEQPDEKECVMLVLRTPLGYRRSAHAGDAVGWCCRANEDCPGKGPLPVPDTCPACGGLLRVGEPAEWPVDFEFAPFPGKILCRGIIAEGMAGRASIGEQLIAAVPVPCIVSARMDRRRHPQPYCYLYSVQPDGVLAAAWTERKI